MMEITDWIDLRNKKDLKLVGAEKCSDGNLGDDTLIVFSYGDRFETAVYASELEAIYAHAAGDATGGYSITVTEGENGEPECNVEASGCGIIEVMNSDAVVEMLTSESYLKMFNEDEHYDDWMYLIEDKQGEDKVVCITDLARTYELHKDVPRGSIKCEMNIGGYYVEGKWVGRSFSFWNPETNEGDELKDAEVLDLVKSDSYQTWMKEKHEIEMQSLRGEISEPEKWKLLRGEIGEQELER